MNRPAGPPCGRARTRRCALGRVLINHIRSAPGTDVRCTPTSGARVDAPRLRISARSDPEPAVSSSSDPETQSRTRREVTITSCADRPLG
jgi:hypothetical protein